MDYLSEYIKKSQATSGTSSESPSRGIRATKLLVKYLAITLKNKQTKTAKLKQIIHEAEVQLKDHKKMSEVIKVLISVEEQLYADFEAA